MSWKKIEEYRKNFEGAIAGIELSLNTDNSIQPLVRWLVSAFREYQDQEQGA